MKARVDYLEIEENKRVLVISDIHGNLDGFKNLLDKVRFSDEDELIILGDFLEKGPKILNTLRYIKTISKQNNVHTLTGNCDEIWEFVRTDTHDDFFRKYITRRKDNIFKEMFTELGIQIKEDLDLQWVKKKLEEHYKDLFDFLMQLPSIIDTDRFTFVHAGIQNGELDNQDQKFCVSTSAFLKSGLKFDKFVIVGHFPTSQYIQSKICCNPVIDYESKIISIDGGNQVKNFGQLNALLMTNTKDPKFTFDYCDDSPIAYVQQEQKESTDSINIIWGDDEIQPFNQEGEFTYCQHLSSGRMLWIPSDTIYIKKERYYCNNATDYYLPVHTGDTVSVISVYRDRFLAKKNGVVGWIMGQPKWVVPASNETKKIPF